MATPANAALTIEELLTELDQTVAKPIRGDIKWYEDHVSIQRGLTQSGAAFIIIAGGSIPLLSLLGLQDFSPDRLAAGRRHRRRQRPGGALSLAGELARILDAQRALRGLLTQWELAMLEAKAHDSPDLAIQASKQIADEANSLVRGETSAFISARTFPSAK